MAAQYQKLMISYIVTNHNLNTCNVWMQRKHVYLFYACRILQFNTYPCMQVDVQSKSVTADRYTQVFYSVSTQNTM